MTAALRPLLSRLLPIALLAPVLSGCGPEKSAFAPACPTPVILAEVGDLSRYQPGARAAGAKGRDLTELIVQARIARIDGNCAEGDRKNAVTTSVTVTLEAVRGPAMIGNRVALPLFIAVTEGDSILTKRLYAAQVEFTGSVDRVAVTSPAVELTLPVTSTKSAAAYSIIAGFQLSPEEVATNRNQMRR